MADIDVKSRKRPRGRPMKSDFDKKKKLKEYQKAYKLKRIALGSAFSRWMEVKTDVGIKTDRQFAEFLLDIYDGRRQGQETSQITTVCGASSQLMLTSQQVQDVWKCQAMGLSQVDHDNSSESESSAEESGSEASMSDMEAISEASDTGNVKIDQEHLNETNCNHPVKSVHCHKDPITDLQVAKTEIYSLLSLLRLSKACCKHLLKWMSSLKLQEGSQGKFYLSERFVIEMTNPHTGSQQGKNPHTGGIQETNPHTGSLQETNPPTGSLLNSETSMLHPGVSPQFKNLMPMSESCVPTTTTQTKPTKSKPKQTKPKQTKPTQTKTAQTKTLNKPEPGDKVASSETEKQAKPHSVPSNLRRKQKFPVQKVRTASVKPIVPIQMFKHYQTENDKDKGELFPFDQNSSDKEVHLIIKQEEVEDYGEASDTTMEYDKASEKGVSPGLDFSLITKSSNNYSDVLKSDFKMTQNLEQNDKPYEIVIKSEPIEDS